MSVAASLPDRPSNARGRRARGAVLAAATDLFAQRGFAGTSIADIAEAAGVAKPSVLYHFPDKDSLWRAAVDALWAEVNGFYAERWPADLPPSRALLEAALLLFTEAALRWPAYIRIPFIEGASPSWRSDWLVDRHFGAHVRTTHRILAACQRRGLIPPGDLHHHQAVLTSGINLFVAQAAMWSRAFDTPVASRESLREQVRLVLDLTFRSETLDSG